MWFIVLLGMFFNFVGFCLLLIKCVGFFIVVVWGGMLISIRDLELILVFFFIIMLLSRMVFVLMRILFLIFGCWLLSKFVFFRVMLCRMEMLFLMMVVLFMISFVVWLKRMLELIVVVGWIFMWNILDIWFCIKNVRDGWLLF